MSALPAKTGRTRKNTLSRVPLPPKPETTTEEEEVSIEQTEIPSAVSSATTGQASLLSGIKRVATTMVVSSAKSGWYLTRAFFRYLRFHPAHALFSALLVIALSLMVITGSQIHEDLILGEISNHSVDEIVTSSRFTREFNIQTVGQRGAEEFLRVGAPLWAQRESVRAVLFHARKAGLAIEDQAVLLATVEVESGFNPAAKAPTTTACGLFQFVRATGKSYGLQQQDCMNPWLNARAGVAHYIDNFNRTVKPQVSHLNGPQRVFRSFELSYYLHHDGPNSSNPSNDVKATVLNGTAFLFQVYDILQKESASRHTAPTFYQRFTENFFKFLHGIVGFFSGEGSMRLAKLQYPSVEGTSSAPENQKK